MERHDATSGSSEIIEGLIKTILTSRVWDHSAYKKSILEKHESWVGLFGEEMVRNDLVDPEQRDGQIHETKSYQIN